MGQIHYKYLLLIAKDFEQFPEKFKRQFHFRMHMALFKNYLQMKKQKEISGGFVSNRRSGLKV